MSDADALAKALPAIAELSAALTHEMQLSPLPIKWAGLSLALTLAGMTRVNGWSEADTLGIMKEAFEMFDAIAQSVPHNENVPARRE